MNVILFDDQLVDHLLPLTYTRPIAEIRVGIVTISEKWKHFIPGKYSFLTRDYLSVKYPLQLEEANLFINGGVIPTRELVEEIIGLSDGDALCLGDKLLAFVTSKDAFNKELINNTESFKIKQTNLAIDKIEYPQQIFSLNGKCIQQDFDWITADRESQKLNHSNQVVGVGQVFVEAGAKVECAILNASDGPIYIGKDAEIMEGSIIRGPFALCDHAATKMGAKIYGPTTIGPHSKVGGELNNVVIFGYSSKAHDGFLGNAVLGEWCNLGADTNNSNLKNNYAEVRLWNYVDERFVPTGLQFCGLIMGDHSKCAINTMFNTGTVVGVFANIFGAGFPRNFVPSFAWGGAAGMKDYKLTAALYVAKLVMQRRGIELNAVESDILETVYNQTAKYRRF